MAPGHSPLTLRSTHKWDLLRGLEEVRAKLHLITDPPRHRLAAEVLAMVSRHSDLIAGLRRSVVHNDANDFNVVLGADGVRGGAQPSVRPAERLTTCLFGRLWGCLTLPT